MREGWGGLTIVIALAMGGCAQQPPAPTATNAPLPAATPTAADQKVASVSKELAQNCATLQTVLMLAKAFDTKHKMTKQIDVAESARKAFCDNPPTDVNGAITTVAAIAVQVNNTLNAEKAKGKQNVAVHAGS